MKKDKEQNYGDCEEKSDTSSSEDSEGEDFLPVEASNPILKENMEAFMKQLKETLLSNERGKIKLGNVKNPILVSLNRYQRCLDKTSPEEHEEYFMNVYKRYRIPILSNKDDRWLRKNKVKIVFGKPKYGIRIFLSAIYNTACELAKSANEKIEAFGDAAGEDDDLDRKDFILLYLYRVFRELAPEQDYDKISEIIQDLEELLDVESESVPLPKSSGQGLNSITQIASGLLQNLTKTAEDNKISPESLDLPKMFNEIFQNDEFKGAFNKIVQNDDFKGIFNKLASGMTQGDEDGPKGAEDMSLDKMLRSVQSTISSPEIGSAVQTAFSSLSESAMREHLPEPKSSDKKDSQQQQQQQNEEGPLLLDLPPVPDT